LCENRECFKQHKKEVHDEEPVEIPIPKIEED
jgi:hypothetical protein